MSKLTIEAGQELKALFGAMSAEEIVELLENTMKANGFRSVAMERRVVFEDGEPRMSPFLIFEQADPREEFEGE